MKEFDTNFVESLSDNSVYDLFKLFIYLDILKKIDSFVLSFNFSFL